MENRTIKELRTLASDMEITGYSRMRKDELIKAVKKVQAAKKRKQARKKAQTAAKTNPVATRKTAKKKPAVKNKKSAATKSVSRRTTVRTSVPSREAPVQISANETVLANEEQRVEDAKFVTTPPGVPIPSSRFAVELNEDIDTLESITGPQLSLLPQKPGLFHAYWSLEPGHLARQPDLCLRLCAISSDQAMLLDEVPLPSDNGHWYFHTDATLTASEIYLQLGYYRTDDDFVTAIRHGIVRIPRLTASSSTDRNWWISKEEFQRLYLLAGGQFRRGRLMWPGDNISSR